MTNTTHLNCLSPCKKVDGITIFINGETDACYVKSNRQSVPESGLTPPPSLLTKVEQVYVSTLKGCLSKGR